MKTKRLNLSDALDREVAAYNNDRSGDAAYWRAVHVQNCAEIRRLRALLAKAGVDPTTPEVAEALARIKT